MMTNVGVIDRALRLAVGGVLLGWSWGEWGPALPDWAAWLTLLVGAYPTVTGLLRYCPALAYAGASTCAEDG